MTESTETVVIEDAQSEFVRIEDIDKRDVVVFPIKITKEKGDGDEFQALWADVIILSGKDTEKIESVPMVVRKMMLTSSPLVRNGERMIEKANRANAAHAGPFSGRINSRPGKFGKKAFGVEAWDADAPIRALANAEAGKYIHERNNVVADADNDFDE